MLIIAEVGNVGTLNLSGYNLILALALSLCFCWLMESIISTFLK